MVEGMVCLLAPGISVAWSWPVGETGTTWPSFGPGGVALILIRIELVLVVLAWRQRILLGLLGGDIAGARGDHQHGRKRAKFVAHDCVLRMRLNVPDAVSFAVGRRRARKRPRSRGAV